MDILLFYKTSKFIFKVSVFYVSRFKYKSTFHDMKHNTQANQADHDSLDDDITNHISTSVICTNAVPAMCGHRMVQLYSFTLMFRTDPHGLQLLPFCLRP